MGRRGRSGVRRRRSQASWSRAPWTRCCTDAGRGGPAHSRGARRARRGCSQERHEPVRGDPGRAGAFRCVRVHRSALKHGVSPEDAIHAARWSLWIEPLDEDGPPYRELRLGFDTQAQRARDRGTDPGQRRRTRHPCDAGSRGVPRPVAVGPGAQHPHAPSAHPPRGSRQTEVHAAVGFDPRRQGPVGAAPAPRSPMPPMVSTTDGDQRRGGRRATTLRTTHAPRSQALSPCDELHRRHCGKLAGQAVGGLRLQCLPRTLYPLVSTSAECCPLSSRTGGAVSEIPWGAAPSPVSWRAGVRATISLKVSTARDGAEKQRSPRRCAQQGRLPARARPARARRGSRG